MKFSLHSIRYNQSISKLHDWSLIKVTGDDREGFFQGQITSDLNSLKLGSAQISARLNRQGKVQSFFFIAKLESCLYLITPKELTASIINDFSKFIIMEDVELIEDVREVWLELNPQIISELTIDSEKIDLNFYGIPARIHFQDISALVRTNEDELERVRILNGWPKWKIDLDENQFINESLLGEIAISYSKGCFLGQETAAKIQNNRGSHFYPMLLELSDSANFDFTKGESLLAPEEGESSVVAKIYYQVENFIWVKVARDYRVDGKVLEFYFQDKKYSGTLKALPYYSASTNEDVAKELFHQGVIEFQKGNSSIALETFERSILFDKNLADAYESIGVILGREEKYAKAIEWMDKLLLVNANSVMAHTNKSLYLMKLGKIEEAEAEKSLATVKSFAHFGEEAKVKKALAEEARKKEEEMQKREKMFLQVLEIDAEDVIALYGLGDINYFRKNFETASEYLEKVISFDPKYSVGYLLLGKCYEALLKKDQAIKIYEVGIKVASKAGEMKPANEMQARLNQIVVGAGLI